MNKQTRTLAVSLAQKHIPGCTPDHAELLCVPLQLLQKHQGSCFLVLFLPLSSLAATTIPAIPLSLFGCNASRFTRTIP